MDVQGKGCDLMAEQKNLTEENVEELKTKLQQMQQDNPELKYRFFEQAEEENDQALNKKILEKLEDINRQLKLIFDGHVLINGAFRKIDLEPKGSKEIKP